MNRKAIFKNLKCELHRARYIQLMYKVSQEPARLISIRFARIFLSVALDSDLGKIFNKKLTLGSDIVKNLYFCQDIGLIKNYYHINYENFSLLDGELTQSYTELGKAYLHYAFPNFDGNPHHILADFGDINPRYENRIKTYSLIHPQISELGFLAFLTKHHLWNAVLNNTKSNNDHKIHEILSFMFSNKSLCKYSTLSEYRLINIPENMMPPDTFINDNTKLAGAIVSEILSHIYYSQIFGLPF